MLAAYLILRPKSRVTGSDGRTFELLAPAGEPDASGQAAASRWRTVPDDGNEYTADLQWELGQTTAAPMFRRFV